MSKSVSSASATVRAPNYYDGPIDLKDDISIRHRYYTFTTDSGLVVGVDVNLIFIIDRVPSEVWPHLKDFNLWQNDYDHYYTGVIGDMYSSEEGDLGREIFRLSSKPNEDFSPNPYQVLKVIPEYLMVIFQPLRGDGGNGGVSRGFHVFMLNEQAGKTVVTVVMEHAFRTTDLSEDEGIDVWREQVPEWQRKWRDDFIPRLRKLVEDTGQTALNTIAKHGT